MASNSAAHHARGESSKASQGTSNTGSASYAQVASSNTGAPSEHIHDGSTTQAPKKRKHRGGKKRRNRRQSFAAPAESVDGGDLASERKPSLVDAGNQSSARSALYRLGSNRSNESIDSEALLDHRGQSSLQTRRQSVQGGLFAHRPSQSLARPSPRREYQNPFSHSKVSRQHENVLSDPGDEDADDRTPLMASSHRDSRPGTGYGGLSVPSNGSKTRERSGRRTSFSSTDSRKRKSGFAPQHPSSTNLGDYDVNNPPSVPGSPVLGPDVGYDDVMITGDLEDRRDLDIHRHNASRDALINIDEEPEVPYAESTPPSPGKDINPDFRRRMTVLRAAEDVCFPQEGMSEIGHEDLHRQEGIESRNRRRRARQWPVLNVLEEWSHEEKEQRTMEGIRTRKVSEPLLVGGRLRPQKRVWHREADDAPYRFTYFNEEFPSTIHSQTISELLQPGQTFRDLFIPDPPVLEDSSDESDEDDAATTGRGSVANGAPYTEHGNGSRLGDIKQQSSGEHTRSSTPRLSTTPQPTKQPRYGPRPAFWLDVLSPTEAEMKVLSQAFGIHPLTSEDIMMQEAREKVELFRNYYFVNYRTFEQDTNNEEYMEPVNMYVVVFREGVISFHFSMTPHPANVRRRIRQLSDYLILSPDWISYAIIDDITDVYAPLIQRIEEEVDEIDDAILRLHSDEDEEESPKKSKRQDSGDYEKLSEFDDSKAESGGDMLRRVGECRKRVMSLYRLLGNKADVIKGFAKRCNEQWDVAPRSEIGLYLGDIQDHIVTMTSNLTHYENLLSRAHSNYLAQINIRMNERQEKTSDILGKLTVLGTIVLPMNIVTGMWGMNVWVPGQELEGNLWWFFGITAGLFIFGFSCYFIAKRVYKIV